MLRSSVLSGKNHANGIESSCIGAIGILEPDSHEQDQVRGRGFPIDRAGISANPGSESGAGTGVTYSLMLNIEFGQE